MRDRHRLIPKKDRVLRGGHSTQSEAGTPGKVQGGAPHRGALTSGRTGSEASSWGYEATSEQHRPG